MSKPLLLLSGHQVHQALWRPLQEHFDLMFGYPNVKQYAESIGLAETLALSEAMTVEAQERALNQTATLTHLAVLQLPIVTRAAAVHFNGQRPPALQQLGDWWPGYVMQQVSMIANVVAALDETIKKRPLAGCVVHEDVSLYTRVLVNWCNSRKIPTMHIPHAMCHLRADGGPDIHRETRAHYLGAAGAAMRAFYARNGHPLERIELIGAPQFEHYYQPDALPGRDEARRVLDVDGLVITYAATWGQTTALRGGFDDEINAGFASILDAAKRRGATLIVKVHPNGGDAEQFYAEGLQQAGVRGLVTRQHLNYVLRASDVLVSQGPSNVCVEAALAGVPSCYIQSEGYDFAHPAIPRGTTQDLAGTAGHAMDAMIDAALAWHDFDEFIEFYNGVHPAGGAIERAVDWLRELCL